MRVARDLWLGLALSLAACWSSSPPPAAPLAAAPAPRPKHPEAPSYSVWDGRYRCSQGITAVRLRITAAPDGTATATFEFGPTPENPAPIPNGAYKLTGGLYVTDDGSLDLSLSPDRWIEQPGSYTMIGLTARSDRAQRVMHGRIDNPSCDWIEVTRQR